MRPIEVDVVIAAPPETVWRIVSDVRDAARHVPAIASIEILDGPAEGVGMRWRETRVMFGRAATEILEIAAWDPPESYVATASSHGMRYRSRVSVARAAGGARLAFTFESQGVTRAARIASTLLAPMMRHAVKKAFRADLAALKTRCEAEADARATR